jgi:hypothetical protein
VKLDVRDTENIWCTGNVEMIMRFSESEPVVYIHYDGWSRKYDEYIPIDSTRLASMGVYTTRSDIPRYEMQQGVNMLHSRIIHSNNTEAVQEQPVQQ